MRERVTITRSKYVPTATVNDSVRNIAYLTHGDSATITTKCYRTAANSTRQIVLIHSTKWKDVRKSSTVNTHDGTPNSKNDATYQTVTPPKNVEYDTEDNDFVRNSVAHVSHVTVTNRVAVFF